MTPPHYSQFDVFSGSPVSTSLATEIDDSQGRWIPLESVISSSGERIRYANALGHGPVWQAVNILAGDVGQLPFRKMVRRGEETRRDTGHPVDKLLRLAPNEVQTPCMWKETMMLYALLWGNGISGIVRDSGGRPIALLPFLPDRTGYERVDDGSYVIVTRIRGEEVPVLPEDTIHIRGLASNGFWGLSVIDVARNVLGHGIALQEHGNAVFRNGARPGGFIKSGKKLTDESRRTLRREWEEMHRGASNTGRLGILTGDMDFVSLSMTNGDAQWLESRRLDREFVASLFNLPAYKLNALENAAVRANLEQQARDYYNTSLSRWTNRFAEECRCKLLTTAECESGEHFFKWFPEAFLRADIESRYKAYMIGRTGEWLSPNDVRRLEDMNPIDGGDAYRNPAINPTDESIASEATTQAVENLIGSRVRAMISAEKSALRREAKHARNYTDWLDQHYGRYEDLAETHLSDACDVAVSVGIAADWRGPIREYVDIRRAAMMDLVGNTTPDHLAQSVDRECEHLLDAAASLTSSILGKQHG